MSEQTAVRSSASRSGAEVWRALRTPALIAIVAIIGSLALSIAVGARTSGPFSPDSAGPSGARALAALLGDHGVEVHGTHELAAATENGAGRTLLVAPGPSLARPDWERIRDANWSHIVLVTPPAAALDVLAPGVDDAGTLSEQSRDADCDLAAATKAGPATVTGTSYSAPAAADSCYGDGVHGTVIRLAAGEQVIDVVGVPRSFSNRRLAQDGNAALALNLIGTHAELVWYVPTYSDADPTPDEGDGPPVVPPWVRYVAWMLAFTVLVTALWRGRRLGPVVTEALPVVVHAAETTEGRARLYRRSRARDRAAAALRESALIRLRRLHGVGPRTPPDGVVGVVAGRTGRDAREVHHLLYGPVPPDDAALLNLSRGLEALTEEVRRT